MTNEPNASSAAASAEPIAISVVTPMHNEELCVEEFLRRTDAALRAIGRTHEIVIVSDGSTDRTEELLRAATVRYPSLRALFLARNVGQCSALYAGIQASRGRVVVVAKGAKKPTSNFRAVLLPFAPLRWLDQLGRRHDLD